MGEYSQPLALQVIADLLGVPEEDHRLFRVRLGLLGPPGKIDDSSGKSFGNLNALKFLERWFTTYIERILDRMRDVRVSDAEHGPPGARRFEYAPSYVLRGLIALDLEFTPANEV
jgi:hypothetical protein